MILSAKERDERIKARCEEFKAGEVAEAVFTASLFALGMRGEAIRTEVRLNWPEKPFRVRAS